MTGEPLRAPRSGGPGEGDAIARRVLAARPACDRRGGRCANGAQCAISQFLGKAHRLGRGNAMNDGDTIIPVHVRNARGGRLCDGHPRCAGIRPGEQYEDWRLPPQRNADTGDHRWKLTVHAPSRPAAGPAGCELAATYRDHAARQAGQP